jgi:hypothetical protein
MSFPWNAWKLVLLVATALGPLAASCAHAETPDPGRLRQEVVGLLTRLDSDQYETRQRAQQRLDELVGSKASAPLVAAEFQRALRRPDLSFEVRWQLTQWRARLPAVPSEKPPEVAPEEIDRLLVQLDDDSYARRVGALERLRWLAENSRLAESLLVKLKQRLARPGLAVESYDRLETMLQAVRSTWLLSDPAGWQTPDISPRQLQQWTADLLGADPPEADVPDGHWSASRLAREQLLDLLAYDREVPRIKAALAVRRVEGLPAAVAARRAELLDLTRPAMIAEFWQGRHNFNAQHLLIGVPSHSPGAARPSHFDRIDARVAHCVSGNSLSPGDWPVGVAFPHPMQSDAIFHLVNLPTPRARMAYECLLKTDEAARLAALSRRTLDRFLAEKRNLREADIQMLRQLDAKEVSRFAGQYFLALEDEPLTGPALVASNVRLGGQYSRNAAMCVQLAQEGTQEALPGLLTALKQNRFLPPTSMTPYRLPWLALLGIAQRDPWPAAEDDLAALLERIDPLVEQRNDGPELAATAAGLLLKRHGQSPDGVGLELVPDPLLTNLSLTGYRFASPKARAALTQWWSGVRKDKRAE